MTYKILSTYLNRILLTSNPLVPNHLYTVKYSSSTPLSIHVDDIQYVIKDNHGKGDEEIYEQMSSQIKSAARYTHQDLCKHE